MATSIEEQISVKVKARLELIIQASGYENTVESVNRTTRLNTVSPKDYQAWVEEGTKTPNNELNCPGNPPAQGWNLPFEVRAILRPSEETTTAIGTIRNQFTADVHKAITTATTGDWAQWDGLALNTEFGPVEPFQDESGSGFTYSFTVLFRTDETSLFVGRA